ncbi:MAG: TonB-dependent receptor [Myxococcota bacterium]
MRCGKRLGRSVLAAVVGTIGGGALATEAQAAPESPAASPQEASRPVGPEALDSEAESDASERGQRVSGTDVREVRVKTTDRRADGLTATGRTIDRAAIKNTPKRSAEDLLRLVPGMLVVQHGNQGKGHQFYVRGFDAVHGSDIELTVDDIPMNEPSNVHAHGYLDLAHIPADAVDRIDVTKGSYRLQQGNFATAGSIAYRLGVPAPDRGTRVLYEAGTTNRHRAAVIHAPRGMSESTFVAAEAMHDQGRYGANRQSQRLSATGKVRLFERGGFWVDGLATAYAARFGLPGTVRLDDLNAGRAEFYDAYQTSTQGESSRAIVGLTAGVEHDKHALTFGVYGKARRLSLDENFTGFLQNPETGDRHHQLQEAGTVGTRGHWAYAAHPRLKLLVHGNWQGNLIEQRQDELTLDGRPWSTTRDLTIRSNTWGLAPGLRALPTRWLMVEGGVRLDLFHYDVTDRLQGGQRFTDTFFAASPRVATQITLGPRFKLFGAYGRGLRSPEARAVTLPETPPENVDLDVFAGGRSAMTTTDSAEVGARVAPGTLIDFGAAAFGTWIGRESIFDHVSGFNVELGPTQRLGVEADVQLHATDWLDVGADVTLVHGRFTHTGAPIPGAPPLLVSTFGTLDHPSGWHTGWRWFLLGPRPLTYGATAGVSTVLDASVGYRHRKWFSVDLSLDNILGSKWREGEYNFASHWDPEAPRSQIPTIHYIAGYPIGARLTVTGWF